jgi:hypothetical protein
MRFALVLSLAVVVGAMVALPASSQTEGFLTPAPPIDGTYDRVAGGFYTDGTHEGDNYYHASDKDPPPTAPLCAPRGDCDCGCDDCPEFHAICDGCPCCGLVLFAGIDSWRGIADRGEALNRPGNNNGGSFGFNYGTNLGRLSEATGIGFQFGGSYGVYDWNGRPFNAGTLTTADAQQQVFITTGFFKKADAVSAFSYGLVYDIMANQAFGAFAVNPTITQWRAQVAYATSAWNEYGVWGTWRDKGSSPLDSFGNSVNLRSINQINFFWHHKWSFKADSWIWLGIPQDSRLDPFEGGNLGDLLIGGSIIAPLNDNVSLYANMQYMHPSSTPGNDAYGEAGWYVAFGLQYYLGGNAVSSTVAGNCWLPYLPLANNGNFLVDASRTGN